MNQSNEKKKRNVILILVHVFASIVFLFLVIALFTTRRNVQLLSAMLEPVVTATPDAELPLGEPVDETTTPVQQTVQPTIAPTQVPATSSLPVTASPQPAVSATVKPTDRPTASPAASATVVPTVRPSVTPTVKPTTTPTSTTTPTPTVKPTTTPTPTVKPTTTPTPTVKPTATPSPTPTVDPNAFTYSVSAKIGVAPALHTFVFVYTDPNDDSYTVTYDGTPMDYDGNKYWIIVPILDSGNYGSHVSVSR